MKALESDIIERQKNALLSFIETIEATGGVNRDLSPVADPEWQDLGEAYAEVHDRLLYNRLRYVQHPRKLLTLTVV